MFGVLLKKQIVEVFRSWVVNPKNNKVRSRASTVGMMILYGFIMIGILGGTFTGVAISLCEGLSEAGFDWMYFAMFGLISIVLGLFGSVFNTYSGLYLAKDNDFLLSMPVPVGYIIASRLFNVYLMGLMYSSVVFIPSAVVYQIVNGFSLKALIGGILMMFEVSLIVLVLSCLLGWVVAKISVKLKNRSIVTVLISIVFIGAYYFVYFKASGLISGFLENAERYGEAIKQNANVIYYWGNNGTGQPVEIAVTLGICLAVAGAMWLLLSKSFINMATSTPKEKKAIYKEKAVKSKSISGALISKEFGRFTSSANYMLNCGFGILFLLAIAVALPFAGANVVDALVTVFGGKAIDVISVGVACMAMLILSMNDMATPSISLEGKNLWIVQALPVDSWQVIRAKISVQLILNLVSTALLDVSLLVTFAVMGFNILPLLMSVVVIALYTVFSSLLDMTIGLKMPNLNWTNEIVPIKQSGGVAIAMFSGWILAAVVGVLYLLLAGFIESIVYLAIISVMLAVASFILYRWLKTKGARILTEL